MKKKQYVQPAIEIVTTSVDNCLLEASPDSVSLFDGEDDSPIDDKTLVW